MAVALAGNIGAALDWAPSDPGISLASYAARWLAQRRGTHKAATVAGDDSILRRHLLPAFGAMPLREIQRSHVRGFIAAKLAAGSSRCHLRLIWSTLRTLFHDAIDEEIITSNPASRMGRRFKLVTPPRVQGEQIKAFTREQLACFLATAAETEPHYYPFLLTMARTGIRIGEALALQWGDIDWTARTIRVERGFSHDVLETPKNGMGRTVDMSAQLAAALRGLYAARKAEGGAGAKAPPWTFVSEAGTPLQVANVRGRVFRRVLERAELPGHFTPHCLRHTFASLLLQQGESPVYVQRQLGHATIGLTCDLYGRWLPMRNVAAVDRLDDPAGPGREAKP
jgi:integrase